MAIDPEKLRALHALAMRRQFEASRQFHPVPKQVEFLAAGADKYERMLSAGNRSGKTETAAFEVSCHLMGWYPDWWTGHRFNRSITAWVVGKTAREVMEGPQEKLIGPAGSFGTGMIWKAAIEGSPTASRSISGGVDTVLVKGPNGISRCSFKTAEQGREALQAAAVDVLWCDEEPPYDIFSEAMTRTLSAEDSRVIVTFTPLLGVTELYKRFTEPTSERAPSCGFFNMTLDECTWYSAEHRKMMQAQWPERERRARALGLPLQGTGMVFTTDEENFTVDLALRQVPGHWPLIWGIDFGTNHPFAAALCAWDREGGLDGQFYVLHTIRMANATPLQHATAMRQIAANVPVAWPHDGGRRTPDEGGAEFVTLKDLYKRLGLQMLGEHATTVHGDFGLYSTVLEMGDHLATKRLFVSRACREFFEEYRMYHFGDDGRIVAIKDDTISAVRYAWMMRRKGRVGGVQPAGLFLGNQRPSIVIPPRMNPFTGQRPKTEPRRY